MLIAGYIQFLSGSRPSYGFRVAEGMWELTRVATIRVDHEIFICIAHRIGEG